MKLGWDDVCVVLTIRVGTEFGDWMIAALGIIVSSCSSKNSSEHSSTAFWITPLMYRVRFVFAPMNPGAINGLPQ